MDRRIAKQAELAKCLQINRVQFGGLLNKLLPGHERRPSKRCAIHHGKQKVLGDEIGSAIPFFGPVSDGTASEVTVGSLNKVTLTDRHWQRQGHRVV